MSTIDLACRQSFSIPPRGAIPCGNKGMLRLGCGYQTFLYLEIPPCIGLRSLKQARLILFKMPTGDTRYQQECPRARYFVYPLLDFFSVYGYLYAQPNIDKDRRVAFYDDPHRCSTEIDITAVANAWLEGTIENKGLLLTGYENMPPITYASGHNEIVGMRPMMRLVCEDVAICRPLSSRRCTVSVGTQRSQAHRSNADAQTAEEDESQP